MFLPIIGATPKDINEMLDHQVDAGVVLPGAPDVSLHEEGFEESAAECYIVLYDGHDHEFEDYVGVIWA